MYRVLYEYSTQYDLFLWSKQQVEGFSTQYSVLSSLPSITVQVHSITIYSTHTQIQVALPSTNIVYSVLVRTSTYTHSLQVHVQVLYK